MNEGRRPPIDSAVLESFRERARTHPLVDRTEVKQENSTTTTLVVQFDVDRYPDSVSTSRLEIRWYENDEYNFHYIENHHEDTTWQCRWDRHPNPHAASAHFHRPPNADTDDVVDDHVDPTYPTDMLSRTFANVRERIEQLWEQRDR